MNNSNIESYLQWLLELKNICYVLMFFIKSIPLNVFFSPEIIPKNAIKLGIRNIPKKIIIDNSVLKIRAKLTNIKLIITPKKSVIIGKPTNNNLMFFIFRRRHPSRAGSYIQL